MPKLWNNGLCYIPMAIFLKKERAVILFSKYDLILQI